METDIFLGVHIDDFSFVLATLGLILLGLTILHTIAFIFSKKIRESSTHTTYSTYLGMAGFAALIATLGALTYQYGFGLNVCEFCWWQRIFMFPLEIIVAISLIFGIKGNHRVIGTLATIGA